MTRKELIEVINVACWETLDFGGNDQTVNITVIDGRHYHTAAVRAADIIDAKLDDEWRAERDW